MRDFLPLGLLGNVKPDAEIAERQIADAAGETGLGLIGENAGEGGHLIGGQVQLDIEVYAACPEHQGDWYFTGHYPTPGGNRLVNQAYVRYIEKMTANH